MLEFSHQIFQHFLQVTIEFRLSEGCRAAEQCQVRSQTAQPRLCVSQGQLWTYRITFPHSWLSSQRCSAKTQVLRVSLSGRAKIQPRQLGKRWAGSSGGISSWGGWIWRSLSAGHELAVHQPQAAAHLVWSQGSSWCFPAVFCVVGNSSHIFTFFSSRRLIADSWDGSAGMVTRVLQSFSDHANGCFNGTRGKEVERCCCPGFLAGERENNLWKSRSKFMAKNSKDLRKPWWHLCPSGSHPTFSSLAFYNQTQSVTQGPAPQMFRLLQNMLGKTLGCSSPGVTPPDLSWGFVAAPPVSPRLGAHTWRWRWSCGWQPPCARPCPVGGSGILEKRFFFFFPHLKEFSVIQWNPLCRWNFWALGL